MRRNDLQDLSNIRLGEAKALLRLGLYDGAYYLAGYAVECALKACIAKETRHYDFPDKKKVDASYTHSLGELVRVTELEEARAEEAGHDPIFRDNWNLVRAWSEQSRYSRNSPESAQALIEAIENGSHGVMRWLKRYW